MHLFPDRPAFLKLCEQGNVVPVYTDLMADFETPVSAYAKLRGAGPAYLLESIEGGENVYRYSFIGCRPRKVYLIGQETTEIRAPGRSPVFTTTPADPLRLIEEELAGCRPVKLPGMPRFMGGAVGFLGYEYVSRVEKTVPMARRDELGLPLLYFLISDTFVVFDRAKQTIRLCVNAHVGEDPGAAYDAACAALLELHDLLRRPNPALQPAALGDTGPLEVPPSNFTRAEFEALVEGSKDYIRSGDIFQIVGSQRFTQPFSKTPLDLYRALRTVNPSPYMFLLDAEEFALVGASPEAHVRLTDGVAEIHPIAGTRRRGATPAEDQALEKELLADAKERAEHLMLVDLARNDLGRVCDFGSVQVPKFMVVERYSHVMHIVSQVEGRLRPDKTAFDLMRATFPAGTVSGAPKVRAMQLIAEMEPVRRSFYAGALGYFSYDGNHDSCITLRTALVKGGKVTLQAGGGWVADSVPADEYFETVNKASALLRAMAIAERF